MATKRATSKPALSGPAGTTHLTSRQAEVLQLAALGFSDKEIAAHLGISRRTVEDRFYELRKRTGIRTRGELLACAGEAGLVRRARSIPPADPSTRLGRSGGPRQKRGARKQSIRTTLMARDVTPSQVQVQHLVDNKVLKPRDVGTTIPPGDREKPPVFLRGTGRDSDRCHVAARSPKLSDGAYAASRVLRDTATTNRDHSGWDYRMRGEPPVSGQDALDALYQVRFQRARLEHAERELIDIARRHGITWLKISGILGLGSAQAAQQRRKRLGAPPGTDGQRAVREELSSGSNSSPPDGARPDGDKGRCVGLGQAKPQ